MQATLTQKNHSSLELVKLLPHDVHPIHYQVRRAVTHTSVQPQRPSEKLGAGYSRRRPRSALDTELLPHDVRPIHYQVPPGCNSHVSTATEAERETWCRILTPSTAVGIGYGASSARRTPHPLPGPAGLQLTRQYSHRGRARNLVQDTHAVGPRSALDTELLPHDASSQSK